MQGRLSLRERLLVVVAAALLPLLAVSVWSTVREHRASAELTQSQLRFAASLLAAHQDRAAQGAEQLLGAIAALPELRQSGAARCQAYFEQLRERYPLYTNMGLLGVDGQPLCHALGAQGTVSAADRDYFQQAIAQKRFVMGEPIFGRITGRAALPFALPVFEGGNIVAVAFATLDLEQAKQALGSVQLPPGARVAVADRHGRVLMQFPDAGVPLRTTKQQELVDAGLNLRARSGEGVNAAGEQRLFAIAPSAPVGESGGFVVRVGLSREALTGAAWDRAEKSIAALLLTMLAAAAAVWWIGGRMIVRPAKQILSTVRRIEQGRLDARVPTHASAARGEFARLAAAFNLMADSLQVRQAGLEAELRRSRGAYAVLDQVINSMQEGLVAVTANGRFLMYNQAAARMFSLQDPPVLPELWPEHFGIHEADQTTLCRAEDLPLVRAALGEGEGHGETHVFVRNALVPEGRLVRCTWHPIKGNAVRGGLVVFTDITQLQRLQSEQAEQFAQLQEAQRKLVESQRIGRMGHWEIDLRTGGFWCSDEVFDLIGVGHGDFSGTLTEFERHVHPDDRPLLKAARDQALLLDGIGLEHEYRVVRGDGLIVWILSVAQARRNEAGDPAWLGGIVQDITQRKQHEEDIESSRAELQAYTLMLQRAAEAAQAITAQPTLQDTLREFVSQACRVIGARRASATLHAQGETFTRTCESTAGIEADEASMSVPILDRRGAAAGTLQIWGKEGAAFTERDEYVALELAQLASIAIENARLFAEVRELNASLESRIVERTVQLARQEQLYRTLAEQAPEVVWHTDRFGNVTYFNRAWYELVGGAPGDWLGQCWQSRIHPEDLAGVLANWAQSSAALAPYTGTRRVLGRDGSYHTMSYKAAPILDSDGKVNSWVGIDTDITEIKAIESALRASNEELEAFSYSVSHDLRAPLGAIGGFSQVLEEKVRATGDERAMHHLSRIQAGVCKMEALIEALLQLARVVRAPVEWREVELTALAHDTVEGLQVQHPDRRVDVRIEEGMQAHGDPRLLRVVVENLIGNAWKFTAQVPAAAIEVGRNPHDGAFFVRDNGVGFDMSYAGKLFTAFQRLHRDNEFPGTGIGLATVRRVIARHQGRVWAESEPGRGTTFYFTLSEVAPPMWLLPREAGG